MANAEETPFTHQHILEELKTEALVAIINNDVEHFKSTLDRAVNSACPDCGVDQLLGQNHSFKPVPIEHAEEHNQVLLRVFRDLQKGQPKLAKDDDGQAESDQKNPDFDVSLNRVLRHYIGKLSHIAAILGHTQIIITMATSVIFASDQQVVLFACLDCTGKAALMLAVQGYHHETTREIRKLLQTVIAGPPTEFGKVEYVFRDTVFLYSFQICFDPLLHPALEALLTKTELFYERVLDDISIMWHIFCKDMEGVLTKRHEQCRSCKGDTSPELHPLHYAVRCYSPYPLTDKEIEILDFLRSLCPHCDSLNFLNRWNMPRGRDYVVIDGTVVHFAVSSYGPQKLCCIHPGFDERGRLKAISDILPQSQEGPNSPFVQMLRFLRNRGADMRKPNHDKLRPLECLPPDADPYVIELLTGETELNADGGGIENEDEENENEEENEADNKEEEGEQGKEDEAER